MLELCEYMINTIEKFNLFQNNYVYYKPAC
jgi:hypothetical protein